MSIANVFLVHLSSFFVLKAYKYVLLTFPFPELIIIALLMSKHLKETIVLR